LEAAQQRIMMNKALVAQQEINNSSIPPPPPQDLTPGSMSIGSTSSSGDGAWNTSALPKLDRRKNFAKMKFTRPASGRFTSGSSKNLFNSQRSLGADGMPDIHLVESNPSLFGTTSSKGSEKGDTSGGKIQVPDIANIFESRRSMMSGLSKISDTSEANSIFSDLSRKIGNVSTRSIAMSEISNMDDHGDIDNLSSDEAETRPQIVSSSTRQMHMDFE
jgi:hypothetical protein